MLFLREETLKSYIIKYPITSSIIFVTTIIFLLTCLDGGSTNIQTAIKYGALYAPLVHNGEYYRLATFALPQVGGLPHYLGNISCILIFCPPLESIIGKFKFFMLYVISNIGAGIAILYSNDNAVTAGASGFNFGVMGVFLALMLLNNRAIDKDARTIIISNFAFNILFTFTVPNISLAGHIGGLITGFIFGILFIRNSKPKKQLPVVN